MTSKKWSEPKYKPTYTNKLYDEHHPSYSYSAGITKRGGDDWIWQGYITAKNKKQAEKLLQEYAKKKYGKNSVAHIATQMKTKTFSSVGRIDTI